MDNKKKNASDLGETQIVRVGKDEGDDYQIGTFHFQDENMTRVMPLAREPKQDQPLPDDEPQEYESGLLDDEYNIDNFRFEDFETPDEGDFPSAVSVERQALENKKSKRKLTDKQRKKRQKIAKILLTVFLVGLISTCMIIGGVAIYLMNFMDNSIGVDLDTLRLNFTTAVYVKDQQTGQYVEYQRVHGTENRVWTSIDNVPANLINACVAIEDERFESHDGVDWKRSFAAVVNQLFRYSDREFGGSTITQQLVKNLTDDRDHSATRKVREMLRAIELEKKYSKDTIMECYLNTIPLGGSCYGVEVASEYYFSKSVSELTLAECAIVAGITNSPNNYRPDTKFEKSWKRACTVLDKMLELEYISKEEYDAAKAETVTVTADKSVLKEKEVNSWFVDTMITQLAEDLAAKYGYTDSEALKNVYNGGYKIYSTLDPAVQKIAEQYAQDPANFEVYAKDGKTTPQVGITIMDYEGHIIACVGGAGIKDGNRLLDRAYTIPNQPGSAMKPLGVYALAVERNLITYSSIMEDSPLTQLDGRDWPVNFYEGYTGNNTIAHAVARSINTIPCKLVKEIGLSDSYQFVTEKLGLHHLNPGVSADETISALAIGGTNGGCTPTELAAAYAIFGNGGKYYRPKTYTVVTDHYGNEVLSTAELGYEQVISPDTADVMNALLQNAVYGRDGTAWMLRNVAGNGMKSYGKSGTSSNYFDNWLIGGTPYYIGALWYGFDTPESTGEVMTHKYMLQHIMEDINRGKPYKDFPHSNDCISAGYCEVTGLRAGSGCGWVTTGRYKNSNLPGYCSGNHG